jgi:uncharacterized protein
MTVAWINEFHYENIGIETNQFIEIAHLGTIAGFKIQLYNGVSTIRKSYSILTINETSSPFNGLQYTVFNYTNIQTGGYDSQSIPDGIALINSIGQVIQFLSYEGSFVALNGPARNMTSTDIGVRELSTTPADYSLQLSPSTGMWIGPIKNTRGRPNSS